MPLPRPETQRLAELYRLGFEQRAPRGPAGERLGKGTGSSLEFQDRRAYVSGDDVRHLDWGAYARTDQLMVRLYREEILPAVELLIDASRSMSVGEEKAQLATDLAALFVAAGRAGGYHVRPLVLRSPPDVTSVERLAREGLEFDDERPLQLCLEGALAQLRPGSLRILVSDFLSPHDATRLVRPLAARGGGLVLVQVLGREDVDPVEGQALRLEDVESGESLDLVLDARTIGRYRERLENLQGALAQEARRAGGSFVSLTVGTSLEEMCRSRLAPEGILVPA